LLNLTVLEERGSVPSISERRDCVGGVDVWAIIEGQRDGSRDRARSDDLSISDGSLAVVVRVSGSKASSEESVLESAHCD
jgi:hypothetical protein